jgi:hypothetical protein
MRQDGMEWNEWNGVGVIDGRDGTEHSDIGLTNG